MAKQKNSNVNINKAPVGVSSKGKKAPAPAPTKPEAEKLTKKQIIIIICVLLVSVIVSGIIIGAVIMVKSINNPDFMKADLSRYISISESDYKGYDIDIPFDFYSEEGVQRKINMLLTDHKKLNEEYKGRYPINNALGLGDVVKIYYRGYTVGEDGKETDFEGSSNFASKITLLEVGTGKIIDADTGEVAGNFIPGFGESLIGIVPAQYPILKKTMSGRIMAGDVIYLSYTVIGGKDGLNKTVESERIDLARTDIDEIYGKGFTEFFTGKIVNGEATGFKNIDEDLEEFITRIGDEKTDTVYSDMKVSFVTRGCENAPLTISVRFPASYGEESLRGQDAFFDVYIDEAVVYDTPLFDDKFITETLKADTEKFSSYKGETLADKYREMLREEHKTEIEESNHEMLLEKMWAHIIPKVKVKKLPKTTVETYYNSYYGEVNRYYSLYSSSYSSSIDSAAIDYLNNTYGASLKAGDDWKGYIMSLAENDVTERLIFYYIIRKENFLPPESEYKKIYDDLYNEVLDYFLERHKDEFSKLEGEEYDKELEVLKSEIDGYYGESYFKEQAYYYYATRKMLEFANIVK